MISDEKRGGGGTFFPAFLSLTGKPCLIVGGGAVALQKTQDLLAAGASLTVVATRFRPEFKKMTGVRCVQRGFRPSDLGSARTRPWLVVAATDNELLHDQIARLCRERRLWVNVVDRPPFCDFIVPAVVRQGPVTVAVSTGGQSPALAKFLGAKLRTFVGPEYGRLGRLLAETRPVLKRLSMDDRREMLKCFVSDPVLNDLKRNPSGAARRYKKMILDAVQRKTNI